MLLGQTAYNRGIRLVNTCFYDAKRLIGRNFDDEFIKENQKYWPFTVANDGNNAPCYEYIDKK